MDNMDRTMTWIFCTLILACGIIGETIVVCEHLTTLSMIKAGYDQVKVEGCSRPVWQKRISENTNSPSS